MRTCLCTTGGLVYNIFAHSTKQILLEFKKSSLICPDIIFPACLYKYLPHAGGLVRNILCTTGGVVFVWVRCLLSNKRGLLATAENNKQKIIKSNAAVWFNIICSINKLTHKYVNIKVNGKSWQNINTNSATKVHWIPKKLNLFTKISIWTFVQSALERCKPIAKYITWYTDIYKWQTYEF